MNIFCEQPDFIDRDPRTARENQVSYTVTEPVQALRHAAFFQEIELDGKSILDLGCCVAATGAWVLSKGASRYVGVEMNPESANIARENLTKYYPDRDHEIICSSVEEYVEGCDERFDIILMAGIVYYVKDYYGFIAKITNLSDNLIIDSRHPALYKIYAMDNLLNEISKIKPVQKGVVTAMQLLQADLEYKHPFTTYNITDGRYNSLMSLGGYAFLLDTLGYDVDTTAYETLKTTIPEHYHRRKRFLVRFKKR